MNRFLIIIFLNLLQADSIAQDSTHKNPLSITGYAEIYYQYDFNKPSDGNRPAFLYSHNRHNEFALNLGFLKATYSIEKLRANLAFAAGTYINSNYAAEPGTLKNIFEANAGIKLSKKKNVWLDAGIFPSHIGFESAVSKDCRTLTRSILAENTPYFETGAKITSTSNNGKWLFSGLLLNGWQRITRLNGNSLLSWGTQVQYKPNEKMLFNYSTIIGTDKPDSNRLSRFFHNLYGIFSITDKIELTAGFDTGTEEKFTNRNKNNTWYALVGLLRYALNDQFSVAGRVEYYHDKNGAIIPSASPNGFQTSGYSLNLDYTPFKNVWIRTEGRMLSSKDPYFSENNRLVRHNVSVISSLAISF